MGSDGSYSALKLLIKDHLTYTFWRLGGRISGDSAPELFLNGIVYDRLIEASTGTPTLQLGNRKCCLVVLILLRVPPISGVWFCQSVAPTQSLNESIIYSFVLEII